jgi:hypothetical protein
VCPTVAMRQPRIEWVTLDAFLDAEWTLFTTMMLPLIQK